jgi:hypothetical protein
MELAAAERAGRTGRLTVAAITRVYNVAHVAEMLGEDQDWLDDLSIDMDPEDGRLTIYGIGEDGVTGFTDFGIDNLQQTIADMRADGRAPPPKSQTT